MDFALFEPATIREILGVHPAQGDGPELLG